MNRKWWIRNFSLENWTFIFKRLSTIFKRMKRVSSCWESFEETRECLKFLFLVDLTSKLTLRNCFLEYMYIYILYVYIYTHLHQDGNAITMVAR